MKKNKNNTSRTSLIKAFCRNIRLLFVYHNLHISFFCKTTPSTVHQNFYKYSLPTTGLQSLLCLFGTSRQYSIRKEKQTEHDSRTKHIIRDLGKQNQFITTNKEHNNYTPPNILERCVLQAGKKDLKSMPGHISVIYRACYEV